ncbi:MAG: NTP transferase domain-containing protein [Pirellulaceae bacterium]
MSEQVENRPMAVVLAAGKGTRMKSELPKVLCTALGKPLVHYVIDSLAFAGVGRMVAVVGYREDLVRESLSDNPNIDFASQTEQLGTGHAVMMCRDQLRNHHGPVVVVAGDSPMLQTSSIQAILGEFSKQRSLRPGNADPRQSDGTGQNRPQRSARI